jgi:hypothetical protein
MAAIVAIAKVPTFILLPLKEFDTPTHGAADRHGCSRKAAALTAAGQGPCGLEFLGNTPSGSWEAKGKPGFQQAFAAKSFETAAI